MGLSHGWAIPNPPGTAFSPRCGLGHASGAGRGRGSLRGLQAPLLSCCEQEVMDKDSTWLRKTLSREIAVAIRKPLAGNG